MADKTLKKVHRSSLQFAMSIFWSILGLAILYVAVFKKVSFNYAIFVILIVSIIHACNLILMLSRPFIKVNAGYLIIYPTVFKKTVIRLDEIKGVKLYEAIRKTILSQDQAKQNSTLIIDRVDGKSIRFEMGLLTTTVRENIISLTKELNLSFSFGTPNINSIA